jgi:hypothetical protein
MAASVDHQYNKLVTQKRKDAGKTFKAGRAKHEGYPIKCQQCGHEKVMLSPTAKYCGRQCASVARGNVVSKVAPDVTVSGTRGAIGEMLAAVDLLGRGYDVFRSVSPACPCDLVAMKDGKLLRVEVRMAARNTVTDTLYWSAMDPKRSDVGAVVTDTGSVIYIDPATKETLPM